MRGAPIADEQPAPLQARNATPLQLRITAACMRCLVVQGVVNRDIKLENTLLDSSPRPLVKICDFGYSKVCSTLPA